MLRLNMARRIRWKMIHGLISYWMMYITHSTETKKKKQRLQKNEDMTLSVMKGDKGKKKEAEHDHLKVNKGDKGKRKAEHDKGKGKQLDDVDLDDLDAHDDDLDAFDLENRIKKLEEGFGRLLKKRRQRMQSW
ncbi:hypothetical protein Tco_1554360 [Tanacetum coccineum]